MSSGSSGTPRVSLTSNSGTSSPRGVPTSFPSSLQPRPPSLLSQASSASDSSQWTDDLPVCVLSGVGYATNQIYRKDGFRTPLHEFEDRSIRVVLDQDTYLYGVFDGHEGSLASDFASQRMPAEILLGQLQGKTDDDDVKAVLHQAFHAVDRGFFDSLDDKLAERAKLLMSLPEDLSDLHLRDEAFEKYPELVNRVETLDAEIRGGTSAVVALVFNNRLYVANAGNSRALLCRTDPEEEGGTLRVFQLSVDHNLNNEEECKRLGDIGIDVESLREVSDLTHTRSIGDFHVKGGYRERTELQSASREPVIVEPEIHGGIEIDSNARFLILMSDGLYNALAEATGTSTPNADIAARVAEEFSNQLTLNGVSQAVVDYVVRTHHDYYIETRSNNQSKNSVGGDLEVLSNTPLAPRTRDDITLLVRNFNYPMPRGVGVSSPASTPSSSTSSIIGATSGAPPPTSAHGKRQGVPLQKIKLPNVSPMSKDSSTTPTPRPDSNPATPTSPTNMFTPSDKSTAPTPPSSLPFNAPNGDGNAQQQSQLIRKQSSRSTTTASVESGVSTQSGEGSPTGSRRRHLFSLPRQRGGGLDLDEDGRIEPYVDFAPFYLLIERIEQERHLEEDSPNAGAGEMTNGHLSAGSGDSFPNTPDADGFVWVPKSPKDDQSQA